MRLGRWEMNGTAAWVLWTALLTTVPTGCHGDTNQGGGTDVGHAKPAGTPQRPRPVPTPPTVDQIDPNSPQAVLDGTSTTQTQQPTRTAAPPNRAK